MYQMVPLGFLPLIYLDLIWRNSKIGTSLHILRSIVVTWNWQWKLSACHFFLSDFWASNFAWSQARTPQRISQSPPQSPVLDELQYVLLGTDICYANEHSPAVRHPLGRTVFTLLSFRSKICTVKLIGVNNGQTIRRRVFDAVCVLYLFHLNITISFPGSSKSMVISSDWKPRSK